jgi:ribonuclease HI
VTKLEGVEKQKLEAERCIEEVGAADLTIFTDGSVVEGVKEGGSGVVVYQEKEEVYRWAGPAGIVCSSYSAELVAMQRALGWLQEVEGWITAAIFTDSLSVLYALKSGEWRGRVGKVVDSIVALEAKGKLLTIAWIPGHCNVLGNEVADQLAEEGSKMAQQETPVDAATHERVVLHSITVPPPPYHMKGAE